MIKVAIIGATGYTGAESIEIILRHPKLKLTYLTAFEQVNIKISEVFSRFVGRCEMMVESLDFDKLKSCADVVLCCLPHKTAMSYIPQILQAGVKVIDYSADYRLRDISVYEQYYKTAHTDTANLARAAFGLPELFREPINKANLVANPGCFPTGVSLGLAPLLKHNLIETSGIIANCVSGVSGAGKKPKAEYHFPNMNDNIFAYGIGTHRHNPEMEQIASDVAGKKVELLFQPHVGCFDRGILSTIYAKPVKEISSQELFDIYSDFYRKERFVNILTEAPKVKDVAGTNYCQIYAAAVKGSVLVFSAIDNLVKGASGQAIQNLNIMFGLDESMGLV